MDWLTIRLRLANGFLRLLRQCVPLALGVFCLLTSAGTVARAAELTPAQKQEMKQLYERATRAYDVGKYNEAIEEYQKAYEIGGDPPMLYNIAQAYRLNDQLSEALRFYRRYLQRAPGARNRDDVERKIAELEKTIEDRRKAAAAVAPPPVTAPPPAPSPTPLGAAPTPAPIVGPPAPGSTPPLASSPPETAPSITPFTEGPSTARKVVSWSIVGVAVACGVVSLAEGLVARSKSNDVTNMSAAGNLTFDPTIETAGKRANNFAIGFGIAGGALAVTGVILLVTADSSPAEAPAQESAPPPAPSAMVTPWLGNGLVGAGAGFRF